MKLDNHIATRFLTDDSLAWEIVDTLFPTLYLEPEGSTVTREAAIAYYSVNYKDQRAYYITETVLDKLSLLKVKKSSIGKIRKRESEDIIDEVETYDWTVFSSVSDRKVTFIFPDNRCIRLSIDSDVMWFCNLEFTPLKTKQVTIRDGKFATIDGNMHWDMFYVHKRLGTLSDNWKHPNIQKIEDFIYRVMCFFYLSENTEEIVAPGQRHGTRKSGKIINSLPVPITVVTSKWNITSIRTEGFNVSGHFRMQPYKTGTKMIWIDPFQKHGYVRHAKKEDEI